MNEVKPSFKCKSPLEKDMMLALKSLFSGYVPEYYQQLANEFVDIAKGYGATESGEPAASLSQPAAESFIGQSEQADFENDTWTFTMQHPYMVGAGFYRISHIGLTTPKATA